MSRASRLWVVAAAIGGAAALATPDAAAQLVFRPVATAGFGEEHTFIALSHNDPQLVLVGTATGAIRRSTDGGATWLSVPVMPERRSFSGRERSPDPRMDWAAAAPGKSAHFQGWSRQRGPQSTPYGLYALSSSKGERGTQILWIEVDRHDDNRIFVGTPDGLYRSTDKGRTYLRIWQGQSDTGEKTVTTVVTDPSIPGRLILGTATGLLYSNNAGATFTKDMDYYIRDSYVRGLFFDNEQKGLVHMAMAGSGMASPDSGEHWITTYWDFWGPRGDVQWISLGPNNVRVMGTRDGVFASWQGGEMGTWQRRGWRFVGETVDRVLATGVPNAWLATTRAGVWLTLDGGLDWSKIFQTGGSEDPRGLVAHRGDPRQIWLLTNRAVYRTGEVAALRAAASAPSRADLVDIPSLQVFWEYVLKRHGLFFKDTARYKARAPWAALLPILSVGATYSNERDTTLMRSFPFLHWPFSYHNRLFRPNWELSGFVFWDLQRLVFDRREMSHHGRIERNHGNLRRELTERVHRLYVEYRRVAHTLAFRPPADLLAREFHEIRLQEIAAFFDGISGGYWSKATGGAR